MLRIVGLIICLPAILLVVLAGIYLAGVALLAIGIGNICMWFIGDEDEKATPQKQSRSKR